MVFDLEPVAMRLSNGAAMKRLMSFKFKLMFKPEQARKAARFAGCKRFVFNQGLEIQLERKENGEKLLSYSELCKVLTISRHNQETSFLADAPTHPLQQALKDLERAFKNFFEKRSGLPRFKRKGKRESFRYPDPKQFKVEQSNSRIFLPKLGWVRYHKSRAITGTAKQITVNRESDGWYVSIQTEELNVSPTRAGCAVGIDVGVAVFATMSDGIKFVSPIDLKTAQKKIAWEQRKLAKKVKGSLNWHKQVGKIQKAYRKIFNARKDFQHKTSTTICKNHAIVIVEELEVKHMSASATGTMESPGKMVKAKSGLNRSILSQGWSEFFRQLEYKLAWTGGLLIRIPPRNTSIQCAKCRYTCRENRTNQASFRCIECGHSENADLNAAQNIKAAGLAVLACGENPLGISLKQEPTVSASCLA
jgi:putative transposase